MTDYKALTEALGVAANMLERDGTPVRAEIAAEVKQAAAIIRQLGAVGVEGVMKCAMGWVSAPFSHQRREALDDALRALAVRVPDGWQLVPVEPTGDMVRNAFHLDLSYMPRHEGPDRAAVYGYPD